MKIPPDMPKSLMARRPDLTKDMTPRELDVLELALADATAVQIGKRLHLSPATVVSHIKMIHWKCGVRRRGQLILQFAALSQQKPAA